MKNILLFIGILLIFQQVGALGMKHNGNNNTHALATQQIHILGSNATLQKHFAAIFHFSFYDDCLNNMNLFVQNNDGRLTFYGSNFLATCTGSQWIPVSSTVIRLSGLCRTRNGNWISSSVDIASYGSCR